VREGSVLMGFPSLFTTLVLKTAAFFVYVHGSDAIYLDGNYGGILIVWDRMSGTFQRRKSILNGLIDEYSRAA
jgi:sterol desaturase/sphingolipid hydroxylase (fatty acid hydroxylase superfamily)